MKISINEAIAHVSFLSISLPLLFYFYKRKNLTLPAHIIGLLVIVAGLSDIVSLILFNQKINNGIVFNFYYVSLFCLLSWFCNQLFIKESTSSHKTIFIAGSVLYFICLLLTIFVQGIFVFHNSLRVFEGVILIGYCILYFNYLSKPCASLSSRTNGSLWFVEGILFYFATSISVFILFQYLMEDAKLDATRAVWSVHNMSNIIKNVLFTVGFYYASLQQKNLKTVEA
jgi:hypothetical protein